MAKGPGAFAPGPSHSANRERDLAALVLLVLTLLLVLLSLLALLAALLALALLLAGVLTLLVVLLLRVLTVVVLVGHLVSPWLAAERPYKHGPNQAAAPIVPPQERR